MPISLRVAGPDDVPRILRFITGLAEYEKLAHKVVATEESLRQTLFGAHPYAEVVIASADGVDAGFALFFHNYSTFLAKPGIYLEDLYVEPAFREQGIGKALLRHLATVAIERKCGRLEWAVLDWNQPAIDFYDSLGAVPLDEWTTYRLTGDALSRLVD